jgi:hypothetical protein
MTVSIESLLRVSGDRFERISAIERYRGDPRHVEGAILLSVNDVEVLSSDLWDDVNWLWPFVIQAADEARREGAGQTYFPDQPILSVSSG